MKSRRPTVIALLLGLFCFGCGQGGMEPCVPVPADCQKFLDKWFAAIKAKDVATFEKSSSFIPFEQIKDMPEATINMMREAKRKYTADSLQGMFKLCGQVHEETLCADRIAPPERNSDG
jgi:hypothetical protein